MCFAHERLRVYQKGLERFQSIQRFMPSWNKRHAFVDHLSRAMESILFNLVEAVRLSERAKKLVTLDYAVGSTCECAACLDIAMLKSLLDPVAGTEEKAHLLEVCKMLIGLRNSWATARVAEGEVDYRPGGSGESESTKFHHEALDMYTVMLSFYRWFASTRPGKSLNAGVERTTDILATRVLLNIAEGNGRYAELSRQSFLDTANAAVAKLAVCLDMGVQRGVWAPKEVDEAKRLLLRVGQMTARKGYM